jgi:hypothetical protein
MNSLGCIEGSTLTFFKDGHSIGRKTVEQLLVGDAVYSPSFSEFKNSDNVYSWSSLTVSDLNIKETVVTDVYEYKHSKVVYFNDEFAGKLSLEQPILVKRNKKYEFLTTAMVRVNDLILYYNYVNNTYKHINIEKITIEEGTFSTYNFYVESGKLFFANGWVIASK